MVDLLYDFTRIKNICGFSIDFTNLNEKLGFRERDDDWKLDLSQLHDSIKSFSGRQEDLDTMLYHKISSDQLNILDIDEECFNLCCELGLNKVVSEVLKSQIESADDVDYGIQATRERGRVGSFVRKFSSQKNDAVNFEVSLASLQSNLTEKNINQILNLHPNKVNHLIKDTDIITKDNILHVLLNRNFLKSLEYLMEDYNVDDLYFQSNRCGNIPLATAIENCYSLLQTKSTESITEKNIDEIFIAKLIWRGMVKSGKKKSISFRLTKLNSESKNILHICAESRMNHLLLEICKDPWLPKKVVEKALCQEDGDKMTPIFRCFSENTVLELFNYVSRFDVNRTNILGNNSIHIFGQKNFVNAIKRILQIASIDGEIDRLLLHKNKDKNTPLMTCVLANSNDSLNLLLCTLFTMDTAGKHKKVINEILHEPNAKGNTLLSLILHYQQGMALSKSLSLQLEKDYHAVANNKTETMAKLTNCLKNNVEPSTEVMNALNDVEKCYEKSTCQILLLFIGLLMIELLIPFLVMVFDMATDTYLVIEYYEEMDHDIIPESNSTILCSKLNETILNGIDEKTEKLFKIPSELTGLPRFVYSILFLIIPWFFYFIEYLHSRYYSNLVQKVI